LVLNQFQDPIILQADPNKVLHNSSQYQLITCAGEGEAGVLE
jgi:hypothetical protein